MTIARASLVAAVVIASLQAFTPSAQACKCMMPTPEAARDNATAVFEGQVTAVEPEPGSDGSGMGKTLVTLSLVRTWKGVENEEVVKVRTADSTAACGIDFEKAKSYLVYARQGEGGLEVNSCGRTRDMAGAAEDLAVLGGGVTPVKVEPVAAPATPAEPPKPPATRTAGCATSTSAKAAASSLFLVMPVMGLVRSRRRKG
jgi:hypothetical protein